MLAKFKRKQLIFQKKKFNLLNIDIFLLFKNIFLPFLKFKLTEINFFQSSENFRKWNGKIENKVCYFPHDRHLSFFKHYSQDNCLLECRLKKISNTCGCAPWYMIDKKASVCGKRGNQVLKNFLIQI